MKPLTIILSLLLLVACQSKDIDHLEDNHPKHPLFKYNAKVTIYCTGTCDCALEGIINHEDPSADYVQCKCDPCQMVVKFSDVVANEDESEALMTHFDTTRLFIEELNEFISDRHNTSVYHIDTLCYFADSSHYTVQFIYTADEATTGSVLYAHTRQNSKTYEISCDGTCDCRERYIFSDPPAMECTCQDCTMTVSEIPE